MVAVFEGNRPVQTRPYGYGNNYLEIIQGGLGGFGLDRPLLPPYQGGLGGILLNLPPKL